MAGERLKEKLGLKELQKEGGWFREIGKSKTEGTVAAMNMGPSEVKDSSSILFMLQGVDFSAWHRLSSDEYFCFHSGSNIRIHMIDGSGAYSSVLVGPVLDLDPEQEEEPVLQYLVPRDTWFASELVNKDLESYCLVSCIVVPPFEWDKFELGELGTLVQLFPEHQERIKPFCRN
ncbi:uncharacterized protein LOC111711087 isoform X2 [Eurytemora carolleeae]|uniref:uncharacterized protein LOC111711087 isoform X2 n=1 Tax=Eurytemora carolleeae TaxID=1294199 RepID=UPI000C78B640|nr:uncharacterized protein LOC111711087 isoform X2 [Eurytemora carolleeae]|eukprot:XP_023341106.1 uncharacterized protein LOC111711087 isoform X2 [Eurytemora affinis]